MHRHFTDIVDKHTPHVNKHVMEGIGYHLTQDLLELLNECARSIFASLPSPVKYAGLERCDIFEEYQMASRPRENKRSYDLATSSFYMVKLKFTYDDKPFAKPIYLYMPYVEKGSIFTISGTLFHVTPILSDQIISPGVDSVFLRLVRDRITAKRVYHTVVINGELQNHHVVWVGVYRKIKEGIKVPPTTAAEACIAHYLFGKMGVYQAFKKYANTDVVIGGKEITTESHPPEEWVIIESSKVKPGTCKDKMYVPSDIKLAIHRSQWSHSAQILSLGLFYIIDHFTGRFKPERSYFESSSLFKRLMGEIFKSGLYGQDKLYSVAEDHYRTTDNNLDTPILRQLKQMGVEVNDFYDLLFYVNLNFNRYVLEQQTNINSMFGKTLEVPFNMIYELTSNMVKALYRLNSLSKSKVPTEQIAYEALAKALTTGKIFGLNRGKNICEQVSATGDHPYFKLACKITSQDTVPRSAKSGKKNGAKKGTVTENEHFHVSHLVAGNPLFLQKSNPAPWVHLNPFIEIDMNTGHILEPERFKPVLNKLAKQLKDHS